MRTDVRSHFFFFNDTATTEIYTLSLHDALPIFLENDLATLLRTTEDRIEGAKAFLEKDRKSTRLNSSHVKISYAVFCLKKKNTFGHSVVHAVFAGLSLRASVRYYWRRDLVLVEP